MSELNQNITRFFNTVSEQVKEMFMKHGQLSEAMFYMLIGEKAIQVPFPIIGDKNQISQLLKAASDHLKPSAIVFASECWIVEEKHDDAMTESDLAKKYAGVSIEHQPGRTECLMFVNETKLASFSVTIPIIRNEKGEASLGAAQNVTNTTGRFSNLLYDYGRAHN